MNQVTDWDGRNYRHPIMKIFITSGRGGGWTERYEITNHLDFFEENQFEKLDDLAEEEVLIEFEVDGVVVWNNGVVL